MPDFANTYAAVQWPADCSACDTTARACSWRIDGCCADCNHTEIKREGEPKHD